MHYVKKHINGIEISFPNRNIVLEKGLKQFLNSLLIEEHTTLEGRIEALKKKYALKYNIPIYINKHLCLFATQPLRDAETVCVNVHAVKKIMPNKLNQTIILFKNNETLILNYPTQYIFKKYQQTLEILEKFSN